MNRILMILVSALVVVSAAACSGAPSESVSTNQEALRYPDPGDDDPPGPVVREPVEYTVSNPYDAPKELQPEIFEAIRKACASSAGCLEASGQDVVAAAGYLASARNEDLFSRDPEQSAAYSAVAAKRAFNISILKIWWINPRQKYWCFLYFIGNGC